MDEYTAAMVEKVVTVVGEVVSKLALRELATRGEEVDLCGEIGTTIPKPKVPNMPPTEPRSSGRLIHSVPVLAVRGSPRGTSWRYSSGTPATPRP